MPPNVWSWQSVIGLEPNCQRNKGVIAHELLHVLGFHHEQNRSDRDKYVVVDLRKVQKGFEAQYHKVNGQTFNTPYDFNSVMHYPADAGM